MLPYLARNVSQMFWKHIIYSSFDIDNSYRVTALSSTAVLKDKIGTKNDCFNCDMSHEKRLNGVKYFKSLLSLINKELNDNL